MRRSTAMMNQAHDGLDLQFTQTLKPPVSPRPVSSISVMPLPQNAVTQSTNSQFREQLEVRISMYMSRPFKLIVVTGSDPINCTLHTAPNFQPSIQDLHIKRSQIRLKQASGTHSGRILCFAMG